MPRMASVAGVEADRGREGALGYSCPWVARPGCVLILVGPACGGGRSRGVGWRILSVSGSAVVVKLQETSRWLRSRQLPSPCAKERPGREPVLLGRGSASLRAWHPGSVEPCQEARLGHILSRGAEKDLTAGPVARLRQSRGPGWEALPWLRRRGPRLEPVRCPESLWPPQWTS